MKPVTDIPNTTTTEPVRSQRTLRSEATMPLRRIENAAGLSITFQPNGVIHAIEHDGLLINQMLADPLRGAISRLYLRIQKPDGIHAVPLTGPASNSSFAVGEDHARWSLRTHDLDINCTLHLHPNDTAWCWRIEANTSSTPHTCDVILVQDIALTMRDAVLINEAYASQYLDHQIHSDANLGPVLLTRQNRPQKGGRHPWLAQACITGAVGCLTDTHQFFGRTSRATGQPERLNANLVGTAVRQHESACLAQQAAPAEVTNNNPAQWTFAASFSPDHPQVSSEQDLNHLTNLSTWAQQASPRSPVSTARIDRHRLDQLPILQAQSMTDDELADHFPGPWRHEEHHNHTLLSFFHDHDAHVVTRAKEMLTERPHGHILRAASSLMPTREELSTTVWMHGVFASHLTIGNTVFHKLLPVARSPLDITRRGGLRIAIHTNNEWQLLAVPSAMEIRRQQSRWIYKSPQTTLTIRTSANNNGPDINCEIQAQGEPARLLLFADPILGNIENENAIQLDIDPEAGRLTLSPATATSDLRFILQTQDPSTIDNIGGDELLFADGRSRNLPVVAITTKPTNNFNITLSADHNTAGQDTSNNPQHDLWSALDADRTLTHNDPAITRLNDALPWMIHNAVIHLASPHGLEQYTGGAWGVRDVCQGPIELLLALGKTHEVRDILLRVFAQQQPDGDWPQWFMFDGYEHIRTAESHGDIIVWPLKALAAYLEASGDHIILDQTLPFYGEDNQPPATILQHIKRALSKINNQTVNGTALVRYGHGDWNDSLQPARPELRDHLVSTWTCELLAQASAELAATLHQLRPELPLADELDTLSSNIRRDLAKHLRPSGVVAGLGYAHENPLRFEPILHPEDTRTGQRLSLIAMTRGILSGVLNREEALHHLDLIEEHLLAPDGARLMDCPPDYHGGLERFFQRAESASAFSREIGLMYVHAHLRYAEALARLGRADQLLHALLQINPIGLNHTVPNASTRQANTYFSSSDADVADRHEASRRYPDIMAGKVPVHGGWRIYSSGPGIFVSVVLRSLLGWSQTHQALILDPVLPARLDGLQHTFTRNDQRIICNYRVGTQGYGPQTVLLNGVKIPNLTRQPHPYRQGGLLIPWDRLKTSPGTALKLEVHLP
ncbi:MAG: hypothetical protein RLN76_11610 [Phycisphaeraceae bacterium]